MSTAHSVSAERARVTPESKSGSSPPSELRRGEVTAWLRRAWFTALAVAVAVAVLVFWNRGLGAASVLLPIRSLLFESFSADVTELDSLGMRQQALAFHVDSPALVAELRARLGNAGLTPLLDSIAALPSTVGKVQRLVRAFSNPMNRGCGEVTDLYDKIFWVRAGNGCCSDHIEVFLALASVVGLQARELSNAVHTTSGVFAPELHRWLFVDPEFGIMAQDSTGRYVSTRELQQVVLSGRSPIYDFFGGGRHIHSSEDPRFAQLYGRSSNFERLSLTLGNNVIQADGQYRTLDALPKPVDQLIGHITGIRPAYRTYIAGASRANIAMRNALHVLAIVVAGAFCLALCLYPATVAWHFARRRCAARTARVLRTHPPPIR